MVIFYVLAKETYVLSLLEILNLKAASLIAHMIFEMCIDTLIDSHR